MALPTAAAPDFGWAEATASKWSVAGSQVDRAKGFGMKAYEVDGHDFFAVWEAAREASADLFGFLEERLAGTEDIRACGAR